MNKFAVAHLGLQVTFTYAVPVFAEQVGAGTFLSGVFQNPPSSGSMFSPVRLIMA
jgi:hypothetical protein